MSLKLTVKAGRINNLSDARYCAGMGVEMMGFIIDPEIEESVSPELFNAITGWISGPVLVGEIASPDFPDIEDYTVSAIQVSYPDLLSAKESEIFDKILVIDLDKTSEAEALDIMELHKNQVKYFLIEKSESKVLKENEWTTLKEWSRKYPVMLGYGVNIDNLNRVIETGITAIAISGSNEERPGYKNYDEIADILEALEE